MKGVIRKYVLQNAQRYGKADPGKIIGKVLGESPELREKAAEVMAEIKKAVSEVNKMKKEDIEEELKKSAPELLEKKKEEKKGLPELSHAEKGIVMRFAPSPSGPLHLGHAYVLALNAGYSRKYKGKLILRLEDTNPGNIDPIAYTQIPEDAKWLTKNAVSEVIVQSDRMEIYYNHALEMLDRGHAYICTCPADDFRKRSGKKEECPCRKSTVAENMKLWKRMFTDFNEGDAVMRFKTDMKHKNPAMRDFPLMRVNTEEHPRQGKKYRVWPLMNISVAVDDYELGMTHILRAKDHADNAKRQEYIQHAMGWNVPQTQFVGRINFTDLELSCSKTKAKINEGLFSGWDDIRLPFLMALKRRGYTPEAFARYAFEVGVSLADKKVSKEEFFKALNAFNKEVIDPVTHRYFFIDDPVEMTVEGAKEQDIELDLHPDNRKGGWKLRTGSRFYIAKNDFDQLKDGKLYRLMDCLNFMRKSGKFVFHSIDYERFKKEGRRIIHWLPAEDKSKLAEVKVMMDDGSARKGLAEETLKKVKEGTVVQFERFGFVRLDSEKAAKMVFWWGHR